MKKIFCCVVLFFNLFLLFGQEEGKILWKKSADKKQSYSFLNQEVNSEYLKVFNKGILDGAPFANILKIDAKGNFRNSPLEFDKPYEYYKVVIDDELYYFLSNGYYVLVKADGIKVYDSTNKIMFIKLFDATYIRDCFLLKDKLVVTTCKKGKKSGIYAFNIANGQEIYKIEFMPAYDAHKPKMYFDLNRIAIIEKSKDLLIYSLDEGKLINKIENFGSKIHYYNFYQVDNDVYFFSVDPYQISFLSLDTGRVISNITYRNKDIDIGLNDIVVEKYAGYYYMFLHGESKNTSSIICIDSNNSNILWEKSFQTNKIKAFKKDNNLFTADKEYAYSIDLRTGRENWKIESPNSMDSILIDNLYLVENEDKKDIVIETAYDILTGAVKWQEKATAKYVNSQIIKEKYLILADEISVRNIDIKSGKVLWSTNEYKDIVYFVYDEKDRKFVLFYKDERGIVELDIDTGRKVWNLETEWDLVDISRTENMAYFADRKNIYGVNILTGEFVLKENLKLTNKINAICYIEKHKKIAVFDSGRGLFIFNPQTKTIEGSLKLVDGPANPLMYAEIKVVGNYALITQISKATQTQNGVIPSRTYLTVVDLKQAKRLNVIRIGYHYYVDLGNFKSWYYDKYGCSYAEEEMYSSFVTGSYIDYRRYIFYPRAEIYKEGIMLVHAAGDKDIEAYEMFPKDALPTENDIKNMTTYFFRVR